MVCSFRPFLSGIFISFGCISDIADENTCHYCYVIVYVGNIYLVSCVIPYLIVGYIDENYQNEIFMNKPVSHSGGLIPEANEKKITHTSMITSHARYIFELKTNYFKMENLVDLKYIRIYTTWYLRICSVLIEMVNSYF